MASLKKLWITRASGVTGHHQLIRRGIPLIRHDVCAEQTRVVTPARSAARQRAIYLIQRSDIALSLSKTDCKFVHIP